MSITSPPGKSPDEVARKFAEMVARSRNLQPCLVVQAERIRLLVDDSFRGERSPDGTAWAPLAERTIDARRKGKGPKVTRIGVDTGLMRNSIATPNQSGAPRAGANFIVLGSDRPYAAAFQFGASKSGTLKRKAYSPKPARDVGTPWTTKQPARPFVPITPGGGLMTSGPAGKTFARISAAVGTYITTGKIK